MCKDSKDANKSQRRYFALPILKTRNQTQQIVIFQRYREKMFCARTLKIISRATLQMEQNGEWRNLRLSRRWKTTVSSPEGPQGAPHLVRCVRKALGRQRRNVSTGMRATAVRARCGDEPPPSWHTAAYRSTVNASSISTPTPAIQPNFRLQYYVLSDQSPAWLRCGFKNPQNVNINELYLLVQQRLWQCGCGIYLSKTEKYVYSKN